MKNESLVLRNYSKIIIATQLINSFKRLLAQSLIASKSLLFKDETSKNINIENFELNQFENSKYVLTSPRSLLACENLSIKVFFLAILILVKNLINFLKPNEILPKTFSEIYSQIGRDRVSLPIAYRIFSKQEIERKGFFFYNLIQRIRPLKSGTGTFL